MLWNLLTSDSSSASSGGCNGFGWITWVLIGAMIIGVWFFGSRRNKAQQDKINATLDAIQPGNKVKTIGGICGVVVEVCPEDNTFILETGSEKSGKSYIKFDKKAVYQTDAVPVEVAKAETPAEEQTEAPVEEAPFEEVAEAPVEEQTEAPVAEEAQEESAEVEEKEE